jgi:iron complex outermembrane receptor protein
MAVVRRLSLALVFGLLCTVRLGAQNPTGNIAGRVVDSLTQQPLPDVSVVVQGTRLGAVTQADGSFVIGNVPSGTQFVRVRRIGFSSPLATVTVPAGGTATMHFALERRVAVLEEVVTTGYGTQRRLAITGSVSTIEATQAAVGIQPNVTNMIEGRAAGVQITQNSGDPGTGAQILIRGGTSISASNEPLYVIDGIPINNVDAENAGVGVQAAPSLPRNPMNMLNPSDIQSISILKDAAATAIYGSRAANGVVLIETKKGVGGPSMVYEVQAGMASPRKYLGLLDGNQYRDFIKAEIALGAMPASRLAAEDTANTDWEHAITRSAPTVNQNLSFSGGSSATQYRASVNYFDQQGIVINNGFRRYQARLNGTHQALDGRLRLGLNLTGSHVINDFLPYENTGGFQGGVFINTVYYNPTHPITLTDASGTRYYETGPGTQALDNPVALANQVQSKGTDDRILGNLSADYDILSSLTARINIGADRVAGDRNDYLPSASPVGSQFGGLAQRTNRDNTTKTLQTLLTFHPTFVTGRDFELVGGYEYEDYIFNEFGAQSQSFLTDALGFNSLSSGAVLVPPFSSNSESRLVSFFGRANASLNDKYFLTGVLRKDGSSTFGIGNKWAVFPAISGSWRLSQESFMRTGPFSELRLRAGYGKVGNPGAPPYASLILLSADGGSRYVFGETPVTGFSPVSNPNPNLKWESTAENNIALDYGFLNNRFTGSLEYYVKKTQDLLLTVNVPQPAVASTRLENVGRIQNKGIEFSLDGQVLNRPSNNWTAGIVFAHNSNKVIDLGPYLSLSEGTVSGQGQSGQNSEIIIPGQPLGTFFGPQFNSVNAAGVQLFNHYVVTRDATGKITSRVLTGTTTNPQGDDFVVLGNANPNYTLGFHGSGTMGKFDLSFLINREAGQKVFNNTALVYSTKGNALTDKNFLISALTDPIGIDQPAIYSSRWIEDGSFTRLQNVTIGYTFDLPRFTGTARNSRVYLSGDNLLLFTGYTGYDPEVFTSAGLATRGIDYLHYPRPRTITGGLRVAF